jgi:uncharacterized protein YndB with AHSA1/START domain
MANGEDYSPGPAAGAQVHKEGEQWTLVLVRDLRHAPEKVWQALVDPVHLREWAPFEADRSLGESGKLVRLSTVGAPASHIAETRVKRADAPHLLEYDWGGRPIRWELEATGDGTQLTLWASIDRHYVSMGATGWHICLDVLDHHLSGSPLGRITGPEALKFAGWQRLNQEYSSSAWNRRAGQVSNNTSREVQFNECDAIAFFGGRYPNSHHTRAGCLDLACG